MSGYVNSPSAKGKKGRLLQASIVSESDSSDNEGTPIPDIIKTTTTNTSETHVHNHQPTSCSPRSSSPNADRLETSDRMSKEKQKFFRLSAFNAEKKRTRAAALEAENRRNHLNSQSVGKKDDNQKVVNKAEVDRKTVKEQSASDNSDSCSTDCSSSESDSSDSDSDSSIDRSETSRMSGTLKIPTLYAPTTEKMKTFGSVGGITSEKESVWGFAAAAAEANKKSDVAPSDVTNKSEEEEEEEKTKSSSRSGLSQLKGLFDGLSHFYAPKIMRARNTPDYNLSRRKKKEDAEIKPQKSDENTSPKNEKKDDETSDKKEIQVTERCSSTRSKKKDMTQKEKEKVETSLVHEMSKRSQKKEQNQKSLNNKPLLPLPSTSPVSSSTSQKHPVSNSSAVQKTEIPKKHMTPSDLVKTAVNSKRHELERRKLLKSETGLGVVGFLSHSAAILEDARSKKRNLIAEATQTNHPLSVLPTANNQTGKIGPQTKNQRNKFQHLHVPLSSPLHLTSFSKSCNKDFQGSHNCL